jgi:hypothetical protein
MLAWLDSWNSGKPYEDQVRPFGFLLSFTPRTGLFAETADLDSCLIDTPRRGRPRRLTDPKPIAPFNSDPGRALAHVIDRLTGDPLEPEKLKTYQEVLCQYHLSSEAKFSNGQFLDRGRTERRHVLATGIALIGKEANLVVESGIGHPIYSASQRFEILPNQIGLCEDHADKSTLGLVGDTHVG